jgi:hypothetical protein
VAPGVHPDPGAAVVAGLHRPFGRQVVVAGVAGGLAPEPLTGSELDDRRVALAAADADRRRPDDPVGPVADVDLVAAEAAVDAMARHAGI